MVVREQLCATMTSTRPRAHFAVNTLVCLVLGAAACSNGPAAAGSGATGSIAGAPTSTGGSPAAGGSGGLTAGAGNGIAGADPNASGVAGSMPIGGSAAGSTAVGGDGGSGGAGGGSGGAGGSVAVTPDAGCTIYAAPNGAGTDCSAQAACSLTGARDKARGLNGTLKADLEICLAAGTYALTEPFTLTENAAIHDSGSNGFNVVYRALDKGVPIISGGRAITGFQVFDAQKNIFKAAAPGLTARQLFVNGKRAQRARSKDNYGMTKADHGFDANTTALASFKNPTHIELSGELDWRHYRCPVESISGKSVRLQSPCWELSQDINGGWWNFKEVSWVENAYELLDDEGEFYLDEAAGELFYKPRAGEDMATVSVIAPVLETIVRGQGTVGTPLHHVAFRGLTFAHGTWHEPSTNLGYTSWQSGFLHRTMKQYYDSGFYVAPSNLVFELVDSLRFEGNVFTHLGSNGLDMFHGSSNNSIVGNRFEDISGRGITLGHIDDYAAPDNEIIKNNTIKNNYIGHIGVEYRDCSMVFIGYTQGTVVEHNWLRYGPYMGISLGWGWASHPDSTAGKNLIRWNRIEDFMQFTFDGSGVYALGVQHGSSVDHNYIFRGLPRGEGIFPDQGASYMAWESNVIEDVGWQWIHDWSSQAHDNVIRNNITNQPNFEHSGGADKHDIFENNQIVTDGKWPAATDEIRTKAGLEPAYAGLAP